EILAEVYAELTGGRQAVLTFGVGEVANLPDGRLLTARPHALPPRLSARELSIHRTFVAELGGVPVWGRYFNLAVASAAAGRVNEPYQAGRVSKGALKP